MGKKIIKESTFSLKFVNNETNFFFFKESSFSIVYLFLPLPPPHPHPSFFSTYGVKKEVFFFTQFSNTDNTWIIFFLLLLSYVIFFRFIRFDFKLFITGVNGCLYNSPVASLAGAHLKLSSTARRHICIGPYHYLYNRRSSNHTCAWEISNVYTTLLRERLGENYSEAVIIDEHD